MAPPLNEPPSLILLEQAITKVDSLTEAVTGLTLLFGDAKTARRRNFLIGASLALLFILGVGVLIYTTQQLDAQQTATRAACQQSNEDKIAQRQLWDGLLLLPSDKPPDPEVLAELKQLLDKAFEHRDCK